MVPLLSKWHSLPHVSSSEDYRSWLHIIHCLLESSCALQDRGTLLFSSFALKCVMDLGLA
jgi:hypothetical protein